VYGGDLGLVYAGMSAVMLGFYLFAIKRYFSAYPAPVYVSFTYASSLLWYVPIALLSVDDRYLPADDGWTGAAVLAFVVVGTVVAVLASFRAIAVGDVSYVAPISKLVPVFVIPVEVAVFGQRLTPLQTAGIVVATAAVYVANYERGALLEPLIRAARSRPAQLALLSAAAFGVTDVGKRALTQELGVPPASVNLVLFVGVALALAPLAIRRIPDGLRRADAGRFLALGLLLAVAEHFVMLSFAALPASLASPIINSSAVFAVVLGGVLLDEDALRVRLGAAALAIAGVTMIAIG
jgi:drug/metabolite transporter (DMT)-like permease